MQNKKIKKYFISGFLLANLFSVAQLQGLKILNIDNDLYQAPNLSAEMSVLAVDLYSPNLNFSIEGGLRYRFSGEKGWIKTSYLVSFADRIDESIDYNNSGLGLPANGTKPLKNICFSAGYNFNQNTYYSKEYISLKTVGHTNYVTPVQLGYLKCYGIHAGFETFRTILAQGSTTEFVGSNMEGYKTDSLVTIEHVTPMFNAGIISIGFHKDIIEHAEITFRSNTETFKRKVNSHYHAYADLLIAPIMKLEDVLFPYNYQGPNAPDPNSLSSSYHENFNYFKMNINDHVKKNPIGARIGCQLNSLNRAGLFSGIELGFRPGPFSPFYNLYLKIKIGFSLNFKAK